MDKNKVYKFWEKRTTVNHPRISTHFQNDDTHLFDLKIIEEYLKPESQILDLACGPCFYSNMIVDKVKYIKAVDKFGKFFKFCKKTPKLETVEMDLVNFEDKHKYNLVLLIGIMHFLNEKEREIVYKKAFKYLKKDGVVYIRHQCGVNEDVDIDKYSKKIGDNYVAKYLKINKEINMLKRIFKKVKVIDIFPQRLNPWPDTHYYAFVCKKK